jgi:hypothetical protein
MERARIVHCIGRNELRMNAEWRYLISLKFDYLEAAANNDVSKPIVFRIG